MKGYGAPSIKRAFAILNAISASKKGLGVSEIARGLNIAKSTTHGMTQALEEIGALIRDQRSKRYRLGFTLLEIGRRAYSQIDLQALTRPVMEDLMTKTRTSVFIGTLNLDRITVLDIVEARQDLKITAPVGTTMSLFAGAVGKVFLASLAPGARVSAQKVALTRMSWRFLRSSGLMPTMPRTSRSRMKIRSSESTWFIRYQLYDLWR